MPVTVTELEFLEVVPVGRPSRPSQELLSTIALVHIRLVATGHANPAAGKMVLMVFY
jgi:hypothetical protein